MKVEGNTQGHSSLDVMNFLNEISSHFPSAISFASGRPAEQFLDASRWGTAMTQFASYFAERNELSLERAYKLLAQYGRTNGMINELIAEHLAIDQAMSCSDSNIVVTAGCQEAIELCVKTLCRDHDDVVLVRTPTYIGITGVCESSGIEMASFSGARAGMLDGLANAVERLERAGKTPKLLYLIPDFDNPTGDVLSARERTDILAFCAARGIVILEDNPYGMYRFEGDAVPTMFALDRHGCVIYLGTFSKTICPSLRVGFAALPTAWFGDEAQARAIRDELSQRKSFITVNTSQISQAIVGGILLQEKGSLRAMAVPALDFYRDSRNTMLQCLGEQFADWRGQVSWNIPAGGFFLSVFLPFPFGAEEAAHCAKDYGVLVMPLSFFALDRADDQHVRLAFSNVGAADIRSGIERFARFVIDRMRTTTHVNR